VSTPGGPPGGEAGASGGGDPGTGIVDAHHHVWDLSVRDHDWLHEEQSWADEASMARLRRSFTVADLEPLAAAAGVTATVVVQTDIGPGESADLLALAASGGLIGAVVGWVDLTAAGTADAIAGLTAQPGGQRLAGIRHPLLSESGDGWLERPDVRRGLAAVAAAGLVFDVVCRPGQLRGALAAARALPGLTFVLDHLGSPDGEPGNGPWARTMRELAALPNTVVKLSGVLSEVFTPGGAAAGVPVIPPAVSPGRAPGSREIDPLVRAYCEQAMGMFGPGRTMFGSDWPPCTLTTSYPDVLAAARAVTGGLTEAELAAVFAGTARRVYRLPG
jgi:L-fucono-1,5-lactonase